MATPERIHLDPRASAPRPEIGLALAGILTTSMAIYHFYLPYAFHWGDALTGVPMLRWGLFMLNASFSYLLLAGGVITIVMALKPAWKERTGRLLIVAMAVYWAFNAAWQVASPMPMPRVLANLRWGFLGFSLSVMLLYASALVPGRSAGQPVPAHPGRPPLRHPGASR
jgi:hypothetical protein